MLAPKSLQAACPAAGRAADAGLPGGCRETMKFLFSDPYAGRFARELPFDLPAPVPLRVLVGRWPAAMLPPSVHDPAGFSEDRLLAHFLFFRDGRRIGLEERVTNTDVINVLLTATGG